MTILISIIIYLIIAFVWCFFTTTAMDSVLDTEDLICCLFWIIVVPYALIEGFILKLKNKKRS